MNVLITGASGGLGRALADECARRGYNLYLTDVDETSLHTLKGGLQRQYGIETAVYACDLTNPQGVDALLSDIDHLGIRLDMLLNVAGVDYEGGFLHRDRENITKIVALNDEATLRITHAALSRRNPNGRFSLVFVSSLASMFPMPLKATYAASKRFLLDFAMALRLELRDQKVSVLTLCPGGLATTQQAMRGIAAQGFWGAATTNPLESVARRTIDRALRGRSLYIPGTLNWTLAQIGKIIPRSWAAAVVYRRWNRAQQEWLHPDPSGCGSAST